MTLLILIQAFIAPFVVAALAALARSFYPLVIAAGFWGVSWWVKGAGIEPMDSIAIALALGAVVVVSMSRLKPAIFIAVQAVLLVVLSWWQVRIFADEIPLLGWVGTFAVLALAIVLPWFAKSAEPEPDATFLKRYDIVGLAWIMPIGMISIVTPIAGSIIIGQIGGLLALLGLLVWVYQGFKLSNSKQLGLLVATPTLFVALMAIHFAYIPWTAYVIAVLGWMPLVIPGLRKQHLIVQLLVLGVVFGVITGTGLYLEWPEGSLY